MKITRFKNTKNRPYEFLLYADVFWSFTISYHLAEFLFLVIVRIMDSIRNMLLKSQFKYKNYVCLSVKELTKILDVNEV